MSRLRSAPRRVLAVAASAFIGLVGAVALASPASAHHPVVSGSAACPDPATGEWVVTWTITSWEEEWPTADQYEILPNPDVLPEGTSVTDIPYGELRDMDQAFTGEQVVPGDATVAKLTVTARWDNQNEGTRTGTVERRNDCKEPSPSPTPTPSPTPAESETPGGEDDGEGGGDLPETGSPTLLIGGIAAALLALGGGLYLVARRRRVSFTSP